MATEASNDWVNVRIQGFDRENLRSLRQNLGVSEHEVVGKALSLYKTLAEWKAKGNQIEMITPARGEIRDELILP